MGAAARAALPRAGEGPFAAGSGAAFALLRAGPALPPMPEAERALLGPMVPARRREFAWGRAAARAALARLGVAAGPLLPDADRVPLWPEGVSGSISHSGPLCAAAACRGPVSVGLDIEEEGALAPDLWGAVLTRAELDRLPARPPGARAAAALAAFTAKEAVYKAHFPLHRTMFGFEAVEISAQGEDGFLARFPGREGPAWRPVRGLWRVGAGWIASGVLLGAARGRRRPS